MKRLVLLSFAALSLACSKPPPPPEPPPPAPVEEPVPEPVKEEPKPEPPKPPEALKKPASTFQVGGKSLSTVPCSEVAELVKKAGWIKADQAAGCATLTVGVYSSDQIMLEKGKVKGKLALLRPAEKPTVPGSATMVPPADQVAALKDKKTAFGMLDADADVAVVVELEEPGKTSEGKKLVDGLVKKAKLVAPRRSRGAVSPTKSDRAVLRSCVRRPSRWSRGDGDVSDG
jgi:hypothetical protein